MNAWTLGAIGAALALLVVANRRDDVLAALGIGETVELDDGTEEQAQGGSLLELSLAALDPATYLPDLSMTAVYDSSRSTSASTNRAAFLAMIRAAEGTATDAGYRTMFGYRYFDSYADHPRQAFRFTNKSGMLLWTTAAGAYQFMAIAPLPTGGMTKVDTWDRLQRKLQLPDFGPESQDRAALELVDEAGALGDVDAGRLEVAISKCRRIWASLPGAGYAQPERSLEHLRIAFVNAGGTLA